MQLPLCISSDPAVTAHNSPIIHSSLLSGGSKVDTTAILDFSGVPLSVPSELLQVVGTLYQTPGF